MSGSSSYVRFRGERDEDEENLMKNEGEKIRQYQAAVLAALAGTAVGTGDGWILTTLVKHKGPDNFGFDMYDYTDHKFLVNVMNIAALVGALVSGFLVEKIGRKQTLILAGLLTLPTWILYMISHKLVFFLMIGTGLGGLASGLVSVAVPLYISEISESSIRGSVGIFFYLQFVAGELFTIIEGSDLNHVASNCVLVASAFLITFIWMPESPFSLLAKGEENKAKTSLKFLRGANHSIEEEVESLKQTVSKRSSIKESLREENTVNGLIISLTIMFLSRVVAIDGFNIRLYKIIVTYHTNTHKDMTTILLLVHVIGIGVAAVFIDRFGRRLLLLISASAMAITLFTLFITDALIMNVSEQIAMIFFTIYLAAYSVGVGPVPWVLMTELVPYQHKALSTVFSATLFWFMVSTASYRLQLFTKLPLEGFFVFNGIMCILIVIFTVFLLPETKGKNANKVTVTNIKSIIFQNRFSSNVNNAV